MTRWQGTVVALLLLAGCGQPIVGTHGDAGTGGGIGGGSGGGGDGGTGGGGGGDGGTGGGLGGGLGGGTGGGLGGGIGGGLGGGTGGGVGGGGTGGGGGSGCNTGERFCSVTGACLANAECCLDSECPAGTGGCFLTTPVCRPVNGGVRGCTYPPSPPTTSCTDDGNLCTDDRCDGDGGCGHPFNNAPCDDNRSCTTGDICALGQCQGTPNCGSPPGECYQVGSCNNPDAGGGCTFVPKPSTAACTDDGNACTDDLCNGSGTCAHPPKANTVSCTDDGNACTDDFCNGSGSCGHPNKPNTAPCMDDGNACTNDLCNGSGTCAHPNKTNGTSCNDGQVCTINDVCTAGACGGTVSCAPPGECYQAGVCATGGGGACQNVPKPSTATCTDDGNACTDDLCNGSGTCAHPPKSSSTACTDDGNECTDDLCNGSGTCAHPNKASTVTCTDDGNACTNDLCNGSGACGHPNKTNGTACNDGKTCTTSDSCTGGVCGGVLNCPSANPCLVGACGGGGACVFNNAPVGTGCDDGLTCTSGDQCTSGSCSGTDVCTGGRFCSSSGCICPGGTLWCAGTSTCQATASACTNVACQQCGYNSVCNGTTITDPNTNYTGTCATSLGTCNAANSQSSASDAYYYKAGGDSTAFMWACVKLLQNPWVTGAYTWARRVPSAGQPGAGPNGCRQGGYYATCDFICLPNFPPSGYRGYCDGAVMNTNLATAVGNGCPDYTNLTPAQNCP